MIKTILCSMALLIANIFISLSIITSSFVLQKLLIDYNSYHIAQATITSAKALNKAATIICKPNYCFSANETSHLLDVAILFEYIKVAGIFSLLVLVLLHTHIHKSIKLVLIFISLIFIVSLIAFPTVFTIFHHVFFPQGNWAFAPDTLLIQMFPPQFWQRIGILFLSILLVNTIILGIFSKLLQKR